MRWGNDDSDIVYSEHTTDSEWLTMARYDDPPQDAVLWDELNSVGTVSDRSIRRAEIAVAKLKMAIKIWKELNH